MKCKVIKRVFGANGEQMELGSIVDRKSADGVFYEAVDVSGKELKTGNKPGVKDLQAEIAQCSDLDRLTELSQDDRKGVQDAVEARLAELNGDNQ